ncbi:enoyl-ACP reductase FabI [Armatimonas rosea]|uniref:Enoyl-[acyl-carrier-protein] reductase [NADH] n=1 Tax=Armatimonas rosea TaxID=685828 RepID=A0A7W9W904_ARMRO|nr:enoyl-ACP reductase [Armatimonas rosea]MBB6052127.1 enoyl-[acyl-carrier protein] reductase I [Armatimonas rosea]
MGFLEGKKGLIYGVRNQRSIAWGCAQSLAREGAELALTFLGEREEQDVKKLSPELGDAVKLIHGCDLTQPEQVESLHAAIKESLGQLDFVIHAVAFAKKEDLTNPFLETSVEGFGLALNVSAYTLVTAARAAEPLMTEGGSILTLTYIGADRVIPNYNVMGVAKAALESSVRYLAHELGPKKIRVNAISAGPVMTLSARGISGFTGMYKSVAEVAPLRKATDIDEVGDTAAFLCSHLSRGITGETLYVDSGYHILGMLTGME